MVFAQGAYHIWSEFEQKNIQVFLGVDSDSQGNRLLKLSNDGLNISPTAIVTDDAVWSAWIDRTDSKHYQFNYIALNRTNDTILEQGTIATSDATTYSPSFAQDGGGKLWLVWSGFDGEDEEIRAAYWNAQAGWSAEIAITDNNVPDALPSIDIASNGDLNIIWEQLSSSGFVTKQRTLSNDDNIVAGADRLAFIAPSSFRNTFNIVGSSGRKSNDETLEFAKHSHPDFINRRHSNILMGSTVYTE